MEATKKYNVIYADPPWQYSQKKSGRNYQHGAAQIYNTIPIPDIAAMDVKSICEKNAVLFLWVTVPLLPEGLGVLQSWGFKYKTMLTWRKSNNNGMGYWFRGQCEHLLLGVRGKVKAFRMQNPNFYQCKSGGHSQKPHYYRELINEAVAKSFNPPIKLELFARSRDGLFPDYEYGGWDIFGNQCNGSVKLEQLQTIYQ